MENDEDNDKCRLCKRVLKTGTPRYSLKTGTERWLDMSAQEILCSLRCLLVYVEDLYYDMESD